MKKKKKMFIENTLKIFISNGGKIAKYEGN